MFIKIVLYLICLLITPLPIHSTLIQQYPYPTPSNTNTSPYNLQKLSQQIQQQLTKIISTKSDGKQFQLEPIQQIEEKYENFHGFCRKYYGYFGEEEERYRKLVFQRNLEEINRFNRNIKRKYNKDINQFADLSEEEFQRQFATLVPRRAMYEEIRVRFLQDVQPVVDIDWTCYSGPVDIQGLCGSCYAFVAADNVAAKYAMYHKGFYMKLSVQQLLSCSTPVLSNGCQGGLFQNAFTYIKQQGLTSNLIYPYQSAFQNLAPTCNSTKKNTGPKKKIISYTTIPKNCHSIKQELKKGPISVGINSLGLQFYRSGVYSGDINTITDHAVLLVGYQESKGFKIKNNWGKTWGMLGYAWISEFEHAGLCSRAISPLISQQQNQLLNPCFP